MSAEKPQAGWRRLAASYLEEWERRREDARARGEPTFKNGYETLAYSLRAACDALDAAEADRDRYKFDLELDRASNGYALLRADFENALTSKEETEKRAELAEARNAVLTEAANRLINKVNRVTAAHRHGSLIQREVLDELSNRQLEIEAVVATPDAHAEAMLAELRAAREILDLLAKASVIEALKELSWRGSSINYPVRLALPKIESWHAAKRKGEG